MDDTREKISKLMGLSIEPARAARLQRPATNEALVSPPRTQTGKRVYNEPLSGRSKVIRQETHDFSESKVSYLNTNPLQNEAILITNLTTQSLPRSSISQEVSSVASSSRHPPVVPHSGVKTRVAYKNTCDLFLQTSTTVRKNVFSRKPRGLLMNTGAAGTPFQDILVTTSLAG